MTEQHTTGEQPTSTTGPADGVGDLSTIGGVQAAFRERGYIADGSLATAVFLALQLGRPLLLEGEAGVG
jgi:MoxR-like ATPase